MPLVCARRLSAPVLRAARRLCSATQDPSQFTSGIEHADNMKAVAAKDQLTWSQYKVPEYHDGNKYTYYDVEVELTPFRGKQPDPRVPDKEPQVTAAAGK